MLQFENLTIIFQEYIININNLQIIIEKIYKYHMSVNKDHKDRHEK